jgi:outer membrane protein assembly factor BamB
VTTRFALFLLLVLPAGADDWPRWRGADGSGVSKEADWKPQALAKPKVLFRAALGEGVASMSVVGGKLYTVGNQGGQDVVSCLDATTGKPVWRHAYKCPAGNFHGPRATPTVADGLVYTLGRNGQAFCLEADTGKVKWQVDLGRLYGAKPGDYGMTGSPLVLGDAVVYNVCLKGVALNKATGEKLWASAGGIAGFASPVAFEQDAKPAVALFTANSLAVLDPATGMETASIAWQTSFDANAADPVFFDGKFFITSGWDKGCALLRLDGRRLGALWQNTELRSQIASPVYLDGHLYGIDDNTPNGALRCLDAANGKTKWTQKGGFGNLLAAGGRLLSIDKAGVLVVCEADPTAYKELARVPVLGRSAKNWTAPVLANGLLYCRDSDGVLICLDVR